MRFRSPLPLGCYGPLHTLEVMLHGHPKLGDVPELVVVSTALDSGCVPQTSATQHVHLPYSPGLSLATAVTILPLRRRSEADHEGYEMLNE
ncbi:hypothetical protein E2C01_041300 [Portunus trituberculatus]|uniref:Uncharacterized protein n=1 Tax=Portunus trituberculatus TaxID=210409 RepID=A0A5B7FJP3_PORTR|nr:hypothetical protein [Portunus trituberculatus]